MKFSIVLFSALYGLLCSADKCCTYCDPPSTKYYSINTKQNTCSELCLKPEQYYVFKHVLPMLQQDTTSSFPCEQREYLLYDTTKTVGKCPVCVDVDVYDNVVISSTK